MPDYRRFYVPGGTVFFTVNLADRRSRLLVERIGELRAAWRKTVRSLPFETAAVCVLPDHLHCIWTLPPGDADFSSRWRLIKSVFSRALPRQADPGRGRRAGERGIWQRRFWERQVRNAREFDALVGYIHWNPVKHGYVCSMDDWPHSSWHRFKREHREGLPPPAEGLHVQER